MVTGKTTVWQLCMGQWTMWKLGSRWNYDNAMLWSRPTGGECSLDSLDRKKPIICAAPPALAIIAWYRTARVSGPACRRAVVSFGEMLFSLLHVTNLHSSSCISWQYLILYSRAHLVQLLLGGGEPEVLVVCDDLERVGAARHRVGRALVGLRRPAHRACNIVRFYTSQISIFQHVNHHSTLFIYIFL